eukprot:8654951-Pyramimonas_sp.AAC.1
MVLVNRFHEPSDEEPGVTAGADCRGAGAAGVGCLPFQGSALRNASPFPLSPAASRGVPEMFLVIQTVRAPGMGCCAVGPGGPSCPG